MSVEVLTQLINEVGFPIAVCAVLFWINRENQKQNAEILTQYRKTIDNNTSAINQLVVSINKRG